MAKRPQPGPARDLTGNIPGATTAKSLVESASAAITPAAAVVLAGLPLTPLAPTLSLDLPTALQPILLSVIGPANILPQVIVPTDIIPAVQSVLPSPITTAILLFLVPASSSSPVVVAFPLPTGTPKSLSGSISVLSTTSQPPTSAPTKSTASTPVTTIITPSPTKAVDDALFLQTKVPILGLLPTILPGGMLG